MAAIICAVFDFRYLVYYKGFQVPKLIVAVVNGAC